MKVSSRVDYALSCLIHLNDSFADSQAVSVKKIALAEGLEADYVEQLLMIMKRNSIVASKRGVRGGYYLERDPRLIKAVEIIRAFDGEVLELVCFRKKGRRKNCVHLGNCQVRKFWHGLGDVITDYLESFSVYDLAKLRKLEKKETKKDDK